MSWLKTFGVMLACLCGLAGILALFIATAYFAVTGSPLAWATGSLTLILLAAFIATLAVKV